MWCRFYIYIYAHVYVFAYIYVCIALVLTILYTRLSEIAANSRWATLLVGPIYSPNLCFENLGYQIFSNAEQPLTVRP